MAYVGDTVLFLLLLTTVAGVGVEGTAEVIMLLSILTNCKCYFHYILQLQKYFNSSSFKFFIMLILYV